jgi:hypothetical protein
MRGRAGFANGDRGGAPIPGSGATAIVCVGAAAAAAVFVAGAAFAGDVDELTSSGAAGSGASEAVRAQSIATRNVSATPITTTKNSTGMSAKIAETRARRRTTPGRRGIREICTVRLERRASRKFPEPSLFPRAPVRENSRQGSAANQSYVNVRYGSRTVWFQDGSVPAGYW